MIKNLALVALLALSFVAAESDVLVLTDENFDSALEEHENILVEFYAPWCGHCKRLEPEYEKAATELKGKFTLAKVDATVENDLASSYGVRGYPTLKVFKLGKPKEYNGGRTASDIVSYCEKQLLPSVSYLESEEDLEEFQKKGKVVVIGFFESKEEDGFKVFEKAATLLRDDYLFGAYIGSGLAEKFEGKENGIILFKSFDEGKAVFEGEIEEKALATFIETESVPLLDEIGPENYQAYIQTGLPLGFLFLSTEADNDELKATFTTLAKKYKTDVNFCWIDYGKYESQASRLGLSGKTVPAFAIDKPDEDGSTHYAYDEEAELTEELVDKWLASFVDGSLEPTVKSEEIPEKNDEPVTVVVGKSFDDIVLDGNKDVLVEFYAPWCGHCKKLAPTYDELGDAFKDDDNIVIAKMDATANDVDPKYKVRGFPTIKFFPAGDKENPLDYDEDRELDAFVKFINKHRTGVKDEL